MQTRQITWRFGMHESEENGFQFHNSYIAFLTLGRQRHVGEQ